MKILQCVPAIAAFVSLSSAVTIAPPFSLYAYGRNISGLPLFLSDDMAYVGHANLIPSSLNVSCWLPSARHCDWSANPLTQYIVTLSNDGMLLVSANSTQADVTLTSSASLYIVTTDDSFKAVGITTSNSSVPTGGVTGPFTFYGNTIM